MAANDSSTQQKEVQGDNVLTLSFTYYEPLALDVNDYTEFEGERYWLTERYTPTQRSEGEWVYDLKLYGIESLLKRFLVLETTDGNAEPEFTLTATPREHVAMIVKCINDGMNHTTDWKVGQVDGNELIVIDYEGKYCDEALKEVAEKVGGGAEWWAEGQTVNVCRCEHGAEIALGYGKGLTEITCDTSNKAKFYTRLFPIGSTRNIDPEKYGHNRLMLPGGRKYVEVHTNEYGIHDHYEKEAFSSIYPRRVGTVSSVRQVERKDDDGKAFTIYYFRDDALNFNPNDYELPGETKRVSFQDGDLAGLGDGDDHSFEVNYDSKTREFEITTIWPYDDETQLPGGLLVPKERDHYILWNVGMPDEYYPLAEEEFLAAVEQYNTEHWRDVSVYKAPTDHVWVEANGADLYVGRRVRLESEAFFPETGFRSSRITKITRKVNLASQMDIEISDALQQGALDRVNDSIGELKNYTKAKTDGVALPDIIRSWDNTLPTDNNLFSARRSQAEHLSKKKNDRAKGKITFEKGASFGVDENAVIDEKGDATLLSLIVKTLLRSPNFRNGFTGEGWKLWLEDGLAKMELDELTVRHIMHVFELIIDKLRSVGGQIIVSAANGKIKTIEDQGESYKITFEQANTYMADDQMRCSTFRNGKELRGYWVKIAESVSGVEEGTGYVIVSKSEFDGQSLPEVGDETALMGNTTNTKRQNLIIISATEDGEPRIDILDGVHEKNFTGCLRARFGNLDGIDDDWFPKDNQPHGNGLYADNAYLRGTFLLTTGEDIRTKFEIVEGKISSEVESLRGEFLKERTMLRNPTFADGFDYWEVYFGRKSYEALMPFNKFVWANNNIMGIKNNGVYFVDDGGEKSIQIIRSHISQNSSFFTRKPSIQIGADGVKEAVPIYVSFLYKVVKAGTLTVAFEDEDKTGFPDFDSLSYEEDVDVTDDYVRFSGFGLWSGTGDFYISFDGGEVLVRDIIISTEREDTLEYRYKTLFEQSANLVKLSASVFGEDKTLLKESGLALESDLAALTSKLYDENGNPSKESGFVATSYFSTMFSNEVDKSNEIVKRAEVSTFVTKDDKGNLESSVRIAGDQIDMAGKVNINNKFKVKLDGSIEAVDGVFSGQITATSGKIGDFSIENGNIIGGAKGSIQVGSENFNNVVGAKEESKILKIQHGVTGPDITATTCIYRTNNSTTLVNPQTEHIDWNNIAVVNAVMLDYFTRYYNAAPESYQNRYGFQYAMLGSGHICMDGIVEGVCVDFMKFTGSKQVQIMTPPMWCNRLCVNSFSYTDCVVILPDKFSMFSCIGCGIINDETTHNFTFRVDIMNIGTNNIYVSGNCKLDVNTGSGAEHEYPFQNDNYPSVFDNAGNSYVNKTTAKEYMYVKPNTMKSFMLIYDGTNYKAFEI